MRRPTPPRPFLIEQGARFWGWSTKPRIREKPLIMTTDEETWHIDKMYYNWKLPAPASWWKRLPVIRHIRAFRLAWLIEKHQRLWRRWGSVANPYDNWVLYAIVRGWV